MDQKGPPGQPGNQAPEIHRYRTPWFQKLWQWLVEDTERPDEAPTKADRREKKNQRSQKHRTRQAQATDAGRAHETRAHPEPQAGQADQEHLGEDDGSEDDGREDDAYTDPGETYAHEEEGWADDEDDGENPEADTRRDEAPRDMRWFLKNFFKSKKRVFVGARIGVLLALVIMTGWISVFSVTGFNPVESMFTTPDPDDPGTWYRAPFFIVESGSMMHPDAPFGRLGTVDPGDVVIIRNVENRSDVQTFYGPGERHTAGGRGDVIVFVPAATRENPFPQPIVHRAMAYLERDVVQIPNPNPTPGGSPTVSAPRFTVAEFGIYDARAVTIPELGLHNYQPDRSGFLTRGDNPRTNDLADQALGVTVYPVEEDRILGRVAHTVPYLGLARIALMGQNENQISPDQQWCSFLAGQAPCDNWIVFLVLVYVFVGVPFMLTLILFTHRAGHRWWERRRFEREQEEAMTRYRAQQAEQAETARSMNEAAALEPHTAVDLLSGKILPAGAPRTTPRRNPQVRTRSGVHYHEGKPR